jgi:ribosomal protein L11
LLDSNVSKEIANLDIGNGTTNPFAAYDPEPPPAPKLKSKGVIAMDITEQFVDAAQSMNFT